MRSPPWSSRVPSKWIPAFVTYALLALLAFWFPLVIAIVTTMLWAYWLMSGLRLRERARAEA